MVIDRNGVGTTVENRASRLTDAIPLGHIQTNEHIEGLTCFRQLVQHLLSGNESIRTRHECKFLINDVVTHKKQRGFLTQSLQGMVQRQLRTKAVSIGTYMTAQDKRAVGPNDLCDIL